MTTYRPFTADKCKDRVATCVDDGGTVYMCRNENCELCGHRCEIGNGFPDGCPHREDTDSFSFRFTSLYGEPH